mmetsp:Transcript_25094/g.54270  ORF Transcript_25094/g.54270 Transcript_25094/m.54270 type:complete len:3102 (+) Transcript_25094:270-9575(+)
MREVKITPASGAVLQECLRMEDLIAFFEGMYDIVLEDKEGNIALSASWSLWFDDSGGVPPELQSEEVFEIGDAKVVAAVVPSASLVDLKVLVTCASGGAIPASITPQDVIDFLSNEQDLMLQKRDEVNAAGAAVWVFWVQAASTEGPIFAADGYQFADAQLRVRVASSVLIAMTPQDPDCTTPVDQTAAVTLFRLMFKATVFTREDGLFECDKEDLGSLVLEPTAQMPTCSVLTVKRVKYICTLAAGTAPAPAPAPGEIRLPRARVTDSITVLPPAPPRADARPMLRRQSSTHTVFIPAAADKSKSSLPPVLVLDTASSESIKQKMQRIPVCAEKTLLGIYHYFKHECHGRQAATAEDAKYATQQIEVLRAQLEKENLSSLLLKNSLVALKNNLTVYSPETSAKKIWDCLKDIQHLDTDFLVDLLQQNKFAAKQIQGKDVILLLGNTGAGKSTTIHFLGNSKMEMVYDRVTGQDHLQINEFLPQLESFVTSANLTSETLFINAIDLSGDNMTFTLVDTPGFGDNRGVEIDIANGLGISEAVRGCRSVRPLYLFSFPTVGDRLDGIVKLLETPIDMMASVEDQLPSFSYWFTKFQDKYKDTDRIYLIASSKLESLKQANNPDNTLISIFEDLVEKIRVRTTDMGSEIAVVLDPTRDNSSELLQELLNSPAIEAPSEVFRNFATAENLGKLKLQLAKHYVSIDAVLPHQEYRIAAYKLKQLKALKDCLQLEDCHNVYNDAVKKVRELAGQLMTGLFDRMETYSLHVSSNSLIVSILKKSASDVCRLYQLDEIRAEHFPDISHYPSSCRTLVVRIQREIASEIVLFHKDASANLMDVLKEKVFDRLGSRLDKMALLGVTFAEVFAEHKLEGDLPLLLLELGDLLTSARKQLRTVFQHLVNQFEEFLGKYEIHECILCLDKIKLFVRYFAASLESNAFVPTEQYATATTALYNCISLHDALTIELLASKSLSDFTPDDILLVQTAASISHAISTATTIHDHFAEKDILDFFAKTFDVLLDHVKESLEKVKVELTNIYRDDQIKMNPFEKIKSRLLPIIELRNQILLSNSTIQAFSDLCEAIRGFVTHLHSEVTTESNLNVFKVGNSWATACSTFSWKLLKLRGALVLADLHASGSRSSLYRDEFYSAEQQLRASLKVVGEHLQETDLSYERPAALMQFYRPLKYMLALQQNYHNSALGQPASVELSAEDEEGVVIIVNRIAEAFCQKVDAQLYLIRGLFPIAPEGDLLAYRVPFADTWTAMRTLSIARAFDMHSVAALVTRAEECARAHGEALAGRLQVLFTDVSLESAKEGDMAYKKGLAEELHTLLEYVRRTVDQFYAARSAELAVEDALVGDPHHVEQMQALYETVFVTHMQPIVEDWLHPSKGRLAVHLLYLQTDSQTATALRGPLTGAQVDALNGKWTVARSLVILDSLFAFSSEVGYVAAASCFADAIRKTNDDISIYIRSENYIKVREFFQARDLTDPQQIANLSNVSKELNDLVLKNLNSLVLKMKSLDLKLSTIATALAYINDLHELKNAMDAVLPYLDKSLMKRLPHDITIITDGLLLKVKAYLSEVDGAIGRADFSFAEQTFQSVQSILDKLFGTKEAFQAYATKQGAVDVQAKREEVGLYIGSVKDKYEAVFKRVLAHLNAGDSMASVGGGSGQISPADLRDEGDDSSFMEVDDYEAPISNIAGTAVVTSWVQAVTSTVATTLFGTSAAVTSKGNWQRGLKPNGAGPTQPVAQVTGYRPEPSVQPSAPSPVGELKALFGQHSPRQLSRQLVNAANYGCANFYTLQEEKLYQLLKSKMLELTGCLSGSKVSRDEKEALINTMTEIMPLLPPKLGPDISPLLGDCSVNLQNEKENAKQRLEENKARDDLTYLLTLFKEYYKFARWTDLYNVVRAILASIRSAVVRLEEDLMQEKFISVLEKLPMLWDLRRTFSNYFRQATDNYYCGFAFRKIDMIGNGSKRDMENCRNSMMQFCAKLGGALNKRFEGISSLKMDDARTFTTMNGQYDVFLKLWSIRSTAVYECLVKEMKSDEMKKFIKYVVSVFEHYNALIVKCANADELSHSDLKIALDNYSQSCELHSKLVSLQADRGARAEFPILLAFSERCKSFKDLKEGAVHDAFDSLKTATQQSLLHNTSLETANALDRDRFYASLFKSYTNLSHSTILQTYIDPARLNLTAIEKECDLHLTKQLDKIEVYLNSLTTTDHEAFSIWLDNLRAFSTAFDNTALAQHTVGITINAKKTFLGNVEKLAVKAMQERDNNRLLPLLFDIKQISVNVALMKKDVDAKIDGILNGIKSRDGSQRIVNLGVLLSAESDPMAQMIVADHKAFEGNQLSVFNTKVARFTADDVLHETDGMRGDGLDRDVLKVQYELFAKEYQALVALGLSRLEQACRETVNEAQLIVKNKTLSHTDRIRRLMVQIFAHWTLSNSEHYFAVEGGGEEGEASAEEHFKYLMQPHAGQLISIFRIFGLDSVRDKKIVNHFVQICTGEGKSVILAVVACIFTLLGYSVDCACYSQYLSRRDYSAFSKLFEEFGVNDSIKYGTFNELCERYLNSAGDIRDTVQGLVETPAGQPWTRSPRAGGGLNSKRKRVLLIDEVDVFFNKDFYGSAYRPLAKVVHPTISDMLDALWSKRGEKSLNFRTAQALPVYAALMARYPGWTFIFQEAVKDMLNDLKTFESHEVKIVGDRIGYKDQDTVSFDIFYGYKTLFAYYKAHAEGKISLNSLNAKKCATIDCGSYSFAEIPKMYKFVLGVSGTLDTLSPSEQTLLTDVYNIRKRSFTPSVYGQNKLSFSPDNGTDVQIDAGNGHFSSITSEITQRRITNDPSLFRPVLVFFESTAILTRYYNSVASGKYKAKMKVMTEEVSATDKENIIRQATSPGSVTILTKEFGRGTDFIIFDSRVSDNGGVHVIQTFLSEEKSEETQIKGRSARQGCKGSYSMILSEPELEKFGVKKERVEEMKMSSKYNAVLQERRSAFFEDKYQDTMQYVEQIAIEHFSAMHFLDALKDLPCSNENAHSTLAPLSSANQSLIVDFLTERNKSPLIESAAFISRTFVVMDATGSMAQLLSKTKNTVKRMFTEALSTLEQAQGVAAGCF